MEIRTYAIALNHNVYRNIVHVSKIVKNVVSNVNVPIVIIILKKEKFIKRLRMNLELNCTV